MVITGIARRGNRAPLAESLTRAAGAWKDKGVIPLPRRMRASLSTVNMQLREEPASRGSAYQGNEVLSSLSPGYWNNVRLRAITARDRRRADRMRLFENQLGKMSMEMRIADAEGRSKQDDSVPKRATQISPGGLEWRLQIK